MRSTTASRVRRRGRSGIALAGLAFEGGLERSGLGFRVDVRAFGLGLGLALALALASASDRAFAADARAKSASPPAPVANAADASAPPTLAALLDAFRTMPGFEARFEEEKTLALLAVPLKSRGRIYFSPPSTLLRRVESPDPHDILIREQVVRIARPSSLSGMRPGAAPARDVETIDLAQRADVRPLVESMVWLFAGDLARLESVYRIDYQPLAPPASGRWQLELVPRAEPLSRLVRALRVVGLGHAAETLVVLEATGDATTTRILEADAARRFAPGELDALFGIGTK